MMRQQNKSLLTGDVREVELIKDVYRGSMERVRKGDEVELARILTALSDLTGEFMGLRL
jgi:hypothetical protein